MSNETTTDYDDGYYYYYQEPFEFFAWTYADYIIQVTLGSLSCLSSILILYIILKSPIKLRSTYHRIMTLLSSFDLMSSFCFALATIPMPTNYIPFKGPTFGNYGTCTAQGFFINFGAGASMDTSLCLAWYYVCIALRVSDRNIRRFYEPIFYVYILVVGLYANIMLYKFGLLNIRPWSPYCGLSPNPNSCWDGTAGPDTDCAWPDSPEHRYNYVTNWMRIYIICVVSLIILAMLIVISVVYRNERRNMRNTEDANIKNTNGTNGTNDTNDTNDTSSGSANIGETKKSKMKQTRLIAVQATMYILAFFVTWIMVVIPFDASSPQYLDILESILFPLQGFWNMIIFVYIKVYLIRQADQSINSNCAALVRLLKSPKTVPDMILSGIDNLNIESHYFEDDEHNDEESSYTTNPSAYDNLSRSTPSHREKNDDPSEKSLVSELSSQKKPLQYYRHVVSLNPFKPKKNPSTGRKIYSSSVSGGSTGAGLSSEGDRQELSSAVKPSESIGGRYRFYPRASNEMPKITEQEEHNQGANDGQ